LADGKDGKGGGPDRTAQRKGRGSIVQKKREPQDKKVWRETRQKTGKRGQFNAKGKEGRFRRVE